MIFNIFKRDIFNYKRGLSYEVRNVNGAFSFFTCIPTKKKKTVYLLILLALFFISHLKSQVYNYDPIRHTNFETNPAFLASDKYNYIANSVHHGNFYGKNKFRYDAINFARHNPKNFSGIGFTANTTYLNDSTHYSYVGVGLAYRIILFNAVYTKLGAMYKLMNCTSSQGNFGYYSFQSEGENWNKKTAGTNVNMSASFSSANDTYYLSCGILNYQFQNQQSGLTSSFPQYYFVNVGDLGKILNSTVWEISYTAFTKKYLQQKMLPLSQYISVLYKGFHITRRSSLRYGSRMGISDGEYFQASPILSYHQNFGRKKDLIVNFLIDVGYNFKTQKVPYNPKSQINLTYIF